MSMSMSMSMWSLRWHFTNKPVTGAPYSIKGYSYSLSDSRTLWWRVRWLKQCRLEVEAELQQRWRRTNRRRKSIPRSSSSHREGSITQRGASCGRYDQHRRRSTSKTPTWTYVGSYVEGLSKVWRHHADKATIGLRENDTIRYDTRCYFNVRSKADIGRLNLPHITWTEFSLELSYM